MQNVVGRPVPPPSTIRAAVPLSLDRIVLRALERQPDQRYPDAKALGDDLETFVQDLRYRSEAIPNLLDELFGREGNSITLTPPDLPVMDLGPSESWPSISESRRELAPPDEEETPATATVGPHWGRRHWAVLATAATLGLLSLLVTARWAENRSEARARHPAVQLAAKPAR